MGMGSGHPRRQSPRGGKIYILNRWTFYVQEVSGYWAKNKENK
jgi:hypothetical protein